MAFLLPLSLTHLGLGWSMAFMAAVSLVGGITGLMRAPETNGLKLTETAHRDARRGTRPAFTPATPLPSARP
ncbi:hypothetical protein ACIQNI_09935 [Streptomyces sp. NPDC091266]|uniref:hypothetical protein n=1 Tax=Streptomyces sp. NPDC091266 TaxID=3365978 RepID=UPI003820BBA2